MEKQSNRYKSIDKVKDESTKSQAASGKVKNNLIDKMLEERKQSKIKLNNKKHEETQSIQQLG